ncbi:hypothetical protein CDAR_307071 [Caerostris darwini]|uniref:Uncharacterized protein n=1 Tax=Caerostris darwini TaxID=1538125 RepID=A0AAV4UWC3_9ARAC|nr:hypothetical protein CDAR_307071 [Caerostris darwini]
MGSPQTKYEKEPAWKPMHSIQDLNREADLKPRPATTEWKYVDYSNEKEPTLVASSDIPAEPLEHPVWGA